LRFFIEDKLPGISMAALKPTGWDFIVKGIESLDLQLGIEYISTPMPLLWKIGRESYHCSVYAIKLMVSRLLKVLLGHSGLIQANVPSSVHQAFVESAIDDVVEIGNRMRRNVEKPASQQDFFSFKQTFDALSLFLSEYKKSVHETADDDITPSSAETMDIEGEKKAIIARCTQSPGPKEVTPLLQNLH
jgi:hypothetical protein